MAAPHDVYFNLHKRLFSVKDRRTGRIAYHAESLIIEQANFIVLESGRQRVIAEKRKNVHAFCRGNVLGIGYPTASDIDAYQDADHLHSVSYNPYKRPTFIDLDTDLPIRQSRIVYAMTREGNPSLFVPTY